MLACTDLPYHSSTVTPLEEAQALQSKTLAHNEHSSTNGPSPAHALPLAVRTHVTICHLRRTTCLANRLDPRSICTELTASRQGTNWLTCGS